MTPEWPWLALIALGAFHGFNPAMGWLFAVALALHRKSAAAIPIAVLAIAVGHTLSVMLFALAFLAAGVMLNLHWAYTGAGLLLIGWAAYHQIYGHSHRVRVGMQTGMVGLVGWSFVMATAHGAGMMILPALMPLCLGETPSTAATSAPMGAVAIGAVLVHSGAMLAVTGAMAWVVYKWIGIAVLRTAWVNLDLLWTIALASTGFLMIMLA